MLNDNGVTVRVPRDIQLVCLDRTSGAKRWTSNGQLPQGQKNPSNLEMNGSPLVVGDNVYVQARASQPMQFDDAYMLCFNLADGKIRWACYK